MNEHEVDIEENIDQQKENSENTDEQSDSTEEIRSNITLKDKVKAYKKYLYEYYCGLFIYLQDRKERYNKISAKVNILPLNEAKNTILAHYTKETNFLRQKRRKMRMGEFEILALIGKGSFGCVYLSRKVDTGEILALKKMEKANFDKQNKVRVMREKKILSKVNSEWLVKLSYSFQDPQYLYLAMEYIPGGDLRSLLTTVGTLDEDTAKWYLVEMICSVVALHNLGYTHRDLKPENFLIDSQGHIKLGDFGLSKEGLKNHYKDTLSYKGLNLNTLQKLDYKTRLFSYQKGKSKYHSVVGSPDYMAVEILRGEEGYDEKVDFWCLGVIFYEMLASLPPFYAESPMIVYNNILDYPNTLEFPELENEEGEVLPCMSKEAWEFILMLVCEPDKRLSTLKQFKNHDYLKEIDFNKIRSHEPPFVPKLEDETDTSYFSQFTDIDVKNELERDESHQQSMDHLISSSPCMFDPNRMAGFTWKKFEEKQLSVTPNSNCISDDHN